MGTVKKIDVDRYEEDRITISLLITEKCNFNCDHCMYDCSPDRDELYMSDEILEDIHKHVILFQSLNMNPTVNIVGGEPTLDMKRFSEILDEVMSWDVEVEMTTNGWWLANIEATVAFFNAVTSYIPNDGTSEGYDGGFTVRISNDVYHNEFRPDYLKGVKTQSSSYSYGYDLPKTDGLQMALASVWEEYELFEPSSYWCDECQKSIDEEECPDCGNYAEMKNSEPLVYPYPVQPNEDMPWIYVESFSDDPSRITPNGRGYSVSRMDSIVSSDGKVSGGILSSYTCNPHGILTDVCLKGSHFDYGTSKDNPFFYLQVVSEYWRDKKACDEAVSCWDCRECAEIWKEENLETAREKFAYLNTLNIEEFKKYVEVEELEYA